MRAALIAFLLMISGSAFALGDSVTVRKIAEFKSVLRAEKDKAKRLEQLEVFKDFLFDRLQTVELPDSDQRRADFAELNEFESNIFLFRFKTVDTASCRLNWRRVTTANAIKRDYDDLSELVSAPSTREALEILKLICGP